MPHVNSIYVECAVDYDGCIGNGRTEEKPISILLLMNYAILNHMENYFKKKTGREETYHRVSMGTLRQTKGLDDYARAHFKSTSAFSMYPKIAEALTKKNLSVEFDPFLMPDAVNELLDGTSYACAVDSNHTEEHAHWHVDASKISMLYAKMHRAAALHPHGPVYLAFYDDQDDILDTVKTFFENNKDLMPPNVRLDLFKYTSGAIKVYARGSIQSNERSLGIDKKYPNTLQVMGNAIFDKATQRQRGAQTIVDYPGIEQIKALQLEETIRTLRTPVIPRGFFQEITFFGGWLDGCMPCMSPRQEMSAQTP